MNTTSGFGIVNVYTTHIWQDINGWHYEQYKNGKLIEKLC